MNDLTHFACLMDPKLGTIRWLERGEADDSEYEYEDEDDFFDPELETAAVREGNLDPAVSENGVESEDDHFDLELEEPIAICEGRVDPRNCTEPGVMVVVAESVLVKRDAQGEREVTKFGF
jgi:hypothetical protein